jgi:hypothetical protein
MAPTCQGPYRCPGCATCTSISAPRRLTAHEERRIARALRNDPPIHGPRPLRLVQTDPDHTTYDAPAICDTTMTCMCPRCQTQRSALINAGPKRVRQPWQLREAA